jgi:hypothetical protein
LSDLLMTLHYMVVEGRMSAEISSSIVARNWVKMQRKHASEAFKSDIRLL